MQTGSWEQLPGNLLFLTSVLLQILMMSVFGENIIREVSNLKILISISCALRVLFFFINNNLYQTLCVISLHQPTDWVWNNPRPHFLTQSKGNNILETFFME